jgi:hypothetical protein
MSYTNGLDKPSDYFNTVTWTGTSDATTSVTGVNFQPDFVWIKNRNVADDHTLHDAIRGSTKTLFSNSTGAEGTNAESIQSFDSDGFTTGNHRGTGGNAGNLMVSWNWLASNTTASNTDGDITSTVSANTTSGFSIVSYTSNGSASQTVGHGLGVAPNVIISKNRTDGGATYGNWVVYHSSLATANDTKILLNSTAASSSTNEWGDTDPTSTVYSVHTSGDGATNHSSDNIVAYCFAEKKGFSKFGKYTGNNNADGPFIYTGFKPAFIMIKDSSAANAWHIRDDKRSPINPSINFLQPNNSDTEVTLGEKIDLLSNGFKIRQTGGKVNDSGNVYIYMAFASEPFTTSTGIPCTAR